MGNATYFLDIFDFYLGLLLTAFKYVVSIFTFVNVTFSDKASQPFFHCLVLYIFQEFVHITFPTSLFSQILHFVVFHVFQDFALGQMNTLFCHLSHLMFSVAILCQWCDIPSLFLNKNKQVLLRYNLHVLQQLQNLSHMQAIIVYHYHKVPETGCKRDMQTIYFIYKSIFTLSLPTPHSVSNTSCLC